MRLGPQHIRNGRIRYRVLQDYPPTNRGRSVPREWRAYAPLRRARASAAPLYQLDQLSAQTFSRNRPVWVHVSSGQSQ